MRSVGGEQALAKSLVVTKVIGLQRGLANVFQNMTSISSSVNNVMKTDSDSISESLSQDPIDKCSNVLGKITGQDIDYWISKRKVLIGRNSSQGSVDINIGISSYVSRKHLVLNYERGRFFLSCVGKNGVFVDGQFNRLGGNPVPLDNV